VVITVKLLHSETTVDYSACQCRILGINFKLFVSLLTIFVVYIILYRFFLTKVLYFDMTCTFNMHLDMAVITLCLITCLVMFS